MKGNTTQLKLEIYPVFVPGVLFSQCRTTTDQNVLENYEGGVSSSPGCEFELGGIKDEKDVVVVALDHSL